MASTSDSDDPNAKGNDEIDKLGAKLSVNSEVKTTLPDTTEWTSPICPVSSVNPSSLEIIRGTQNEGRQTFPSIFNDLGRNHRTFSTYDGDSLNDIDRTIRGSHIAKELRCNSSIVDNDDNILNWKLEEIKLKDVKGEDLNGIFYEEELSAYNPGKDVEYKIEKVLGKKTIKGKKYALVKY